MSGQIERNPFYSETKQMSEDAEREMRETCRKYWKQQYKEITYRIATTEGSLKKFRTEMDNHMETDPDTIQSRKVTLSYNERVAEMRKRRGMS